MFLSLILLMVFFSPDFIFLSFLFDYSQCRRFSFDFLYWFRELHVFRSAFGRGINSYEDYLCKDIHVKHKHYGRGSFSSPICFTLLFRKKNLFTFLMNFFSFGTDFSLVCSFFCICGLCGPGLNHQNKSFIVIVSLVLWYG